MTIRDRAAKLNERAIAAQGKGQADEAVKLYRKAIALDRGWGVPLYNLGLLHKNRRQWAESLDCNRRAAALDPDYKAAWWNMGIAATALRDWGQARAAWRGFGIDLPAGEGPVDLPCGFCPIRLHPDGEAEVVWAYRLDPARASLASIPFPESGHRWRDVVLNDGAPVGYRKYRGEDVPVFNALDLLEPGPFGTYVAQVAIPPQGKHAEKLAETAAEMGGCAEDWSTSVRILCKACSEGRPHAEHDEEAAPPKGAHLIGVAARDREHARAILSAWEAATRGVEVQTVTEALVPGG
jgi:tetratricopeptide (TPR) repeat protein